MRTIDVLDEDRSRDPLQARKKAMDYLARREHARVELLDKLRRFGFDPDVAAAAVTQLVDDGLQSDQRFVEAFIRSRIDQGKGPLKIRADLRGRGISAGLIDAGLVEADQDWHELAREVRARKFGSGRIGDFREKTRQMRFLQSRGFEQDHIQSAVSADGVF